MKLSDRIRIAREEMKLTQEEFAANIGMTRSAVQKWEQGQADPYPKTLRKISEVTGKPLEWFGQVGTTKVLEHTRPSNADASSLPRTAPLPPSKAKPIRDARQRLRQARDVLATLNQELLEPNDDPAKLAMRGINRAQRDIIAALDELDKLMEG